MKPHVRTALGWLVVGKIPVLFILMTLMQPKGVEEQDALVKQLTDPNPCKDPGGALRELKHWFTSVERGPAV